MTNAKTQLMLNRLALRGLPISDDPDFIRMGAWVRVTCAVCATVVAIGTAFALTPLLWFLVIVAAIGAVGPRHPFDAVYNHVIRRFTGTIAYPRNRGPAKFASAVGATWITAVALAFESGHPMLATVLGFAFVVVASHVVITQLCLPSIIFQFLFGDRSLIRPAISVGSQRAQGEQMA